MTSLQVHGLTKRFGDVSAVEDLSFEVQAGRVTGFLGPNGAGKTTTLRMLLGLVTATAGTATFDGRRYDELEAPVRRVGAVLDSGGFAPGRSARDHLRVMCMAAQLPDARADEVLRQVGLSEAGRRRVGGFSLGMKQRLGLAAALLGDPEILVLDEPTNGLDPEGVHWLREFLRSSAEQGRTVLVSSHLLSEVVQTVDDVVIIADGRLVTQSSLAELADRVRPGVRVRTPQPEELRAALAAEGHAVELESADTLVAFDTTTEHVGVIAAGARIVIYEMSTQRFDLEQFFLQLTTKDGVIQ